MAGFRALPSVDQFLLSDKGQALVTLHGRAQVREALRERLDTMRDAIRAGEDGDILVAELPDLLNADLSDRARSNLRPLLNLTGVVLHTGLGRAPLAEPAIEAATAAMRAPLALEYDLTQGQRGQRDDHLRGLLVELTGAEDATVVNNTAAALVLILNSLALGRETIISRGELVEIGASFRLPDLIARSCSVMAEVGTTNRTHPRDYQEAICDRTGAILKIEPSNFRIEGFTADVPVAALAGLSGKTPVVHDLGSGALIDLSRYGLPRTMTAREALEQGADVVCFSGDKLLGGAQGGIIVGRRDVIAQINKNPLKRALRLDKIRIAALEATLRLYRDPDRLVERLPALRLLARPLSDIQEMAIRLAPYVTARLSALGVYAEVCPCDSEVGAGAMPLQSLPSAGLRLVSERPEALAAKLRALPQPILGRLYQGDLVLDLRTLEDETLLLQALSAI